MKNGIAMISKFSMPVKSFIATDSIGTCVKKKRNESTVRPSEIDTGIPVSIRAKRRMKMTDAFISSSCRPGSRSLFGSTSPGCRSGTTMTGMTSSTFTSSMPSTCPWSWCGRCPVRKKDHATCRKRKHIR